MYEIDKKEERKAIYNEYKALNQLVGSLLLIEDASPRQMDDLAYYNRKLNEARVRIKREARAAK